MEGKTISINCSRCDEPLILLKINTEYLLLENIYCADCIDKFVD